MEYLDQPVPPLVFRLSTTALSKTLSTANMSTNLHQHPHEFKTTKTTKTNYYSVCFKDRVKSEVENMDNLYPSLCCMQYLC